MTGVPIDDRGLLLGDGLFETILYRAGEPVLWWEHLARLGRGCAALGLPEPDARTVRVESARAIAAAGLHDDRAAVRITWTAGPGGRGLGRPEALAPRLIVTAAPSARSATPAALITATVRRNADSIVSRLKTLSYLDNVLARREAVAAGADEALMLDTDGHLACAAAANLFWIADGRLHTPSLSGGVLPGIIRQQILSAATRMDAPVQEVSAGPQALHGAQALFLTNSLIGLRRIAQLDGAPCGDHPLVGRLEQALDAFV
jgi:branched-subunit amino acid aminotransferase/4-amino-4-deoxychorismate lyase